jgi:hypothetical protein
MSDPILIKIGGVWDYDTWEVHFNAPVTAYWGTIYLGEEAWSNNPCPHAVEITEDKNKRGHHLNWNVPRVVVAMNEAGFSTTGVCLDCIVEWSQANE